MAAKKRIWIICIGVGLSALLIALLLIIGIGSAPATPVTVMGYEDLIFKTDRIHRIEIYTDDRFLKTCADEEYSSCTVVINGEQLDNVGLRAQEASTLSETDSSRYRLQLEFDRYEPRQTYHRLDKLELNNLFQDNTMMKDYLTYQLMEQLGVAAPLCSYTTVYINGRSLGLYLAVEAIEESFLERYYGSDHGQLYKPQADTTDPLQDVKLQYIDDNPKSYPHIFDNAKTDVTQADQARLIQALKQLSTGKKLKTALDIEAVIRYFTVHNFVCNDDSYTGTTVFNYYLHEKDGKLTMLPRNYHLAFGGILTGDASGVVNRSIFSPVSNGEQEDRPMLSWILEQGKYTWLYKRYYIELLSIDMEAIIEQAQKMISPYVLRDPSRLCTYEEFEAGVETLKQFLELRTESVRQQLWNKSATVDVGDLDLSKMGGITAA